jgi:hypothetical protein
LIKNIQIFTTGEKTTPVANGSLVSLTLVSNLPLVTLSHFYDAGSKFANNATLHRHNTKHSKQIFPEKELRGLSPNFHIHVCE